MEKVIKNTPDHSATRSGGVSRESQLGNATIISAKTEKHLDPTPTTLEGHNSLLYCWCASGSGKIEADGQEFQFTRGNAVFLPWGEKISFKPDELRPFYIKYLYIVPFHDPKVELLSSNVIDYDSSIIKNVDHPMLREVTFYDDIDDTSLAVLFNYALAVFSRETPPLPVARQMARLFLYEFLHLKMSLPTEEEGNVPRKLQELIDYIKENISEDISLKDIASHSELSQATINRFFRDHLGTSTMNFIHKKKIERAKHLLLVTDLAISDIGPHIGINDVYYFSRFFKKMTGYSPTQFRRL